MKYKIELVFSNKKERDIIVDVINEHELISTIYTNNSTVTEGLDIKEFTVLSESLTHNLYQALSGRVHRNGGWTNK